MKLRPNRTLIRTLLYVGMLLIPVTLNAVNPMNGNVYRNLFGVTFNLAFVLAAWVEHALVLNRFLNGRSSGWAWAVLGSVGAG